jgi:hypothetical protein
VTVTTDQSRVPVPASGQLDQLLVVGLWVTVEAPERGSVGVAGQVEELVQPGADG